ncbi:lamin tail domain-containing protein [bacterium]|nr:lamin tail domain-containing protein [bacterium]
MICAPAAQAKMMSDTIVIAGVVGNDTLTGSADGYILLYNPRPDTITLNGILDIRVDLTTRTPVFTRNTIPGFGFFNVEEARQSIDSDAHLSLAVGSAALAGNDTVTVFLSNYRGDSVSYGEDLQDGEPPTILSVPAANNGVFRFPWRSGAGAGIDRNTNRYDFEEIAGDTRIVSVNTARRALMFLVAPNTVTVNEASAFTLSCTAVAWVDGVLGSEAVVSYTDTNAWADIDIVDSTAPNATISPDTTGGTGNFSNGTRNVSMTINGVGNFTVRISDAFSTGQVVITVNALGETLTVAAPVTEGNRHETTATTVFISGISSGDSDPDDPALRQSDTIGVLINDADSRSNRLHTETGVWSVPVTLRENTGETIIVHLVKYGDGLTMDTPSTAVGQTIAETIFIVVDNTPPKLLRAGDTSVRNDSTVGAIDQLVFFYVVDTGAGFDGNGGCTLYWHVDSGANTNFTAAAEKDLSNGTWAIEATIPAGSFSPSVDTKVGFWWRCFDDVYNGTSSLASSLSSPAYTADNPGTFTIDVPSVRDVIISEIMADGNFGEYVELHNTTATAVGLNGWTLSDAGSAATSFNAAFTSDDIIQAYGYFLVMSADYDTDGFTISDPSNHDTFGVSDWDQNDLGSADTLSLRNASNVEFDSIGASVSAEWAGGSTDTKYFFSYERKLSLSGGRLVAAYGDDVGQWDTNTGKVGYGGRWHGTPGHANSINVPNIDTITPNDAVVQQGGRGEWDITIRNGNIPFSSQGAIVLQVPPGWTAPQSSSSSPGYTTIVAGSEVNGAAGGSLSFSGGSVIYSPTQFDAGARVTLRYGDNASSRDGIAQASTTSTGRQLFQLFFDTDGASYEAVGDSDLANVRAIFDGVPMSERTDSSSVVLIVRLDTYVADTDPAVNPQSFLNSEYQFTWTVSDSESRPVYGAHIIADTDGRTLDALEDTFFPHLSEYSGFSGFYRSPASSSTGVQFGGWTNSAGQFTFTVRVSETEGANHILIRDTDFDGPDSHVFTDSARPPVPVISEVGWHGAAEFVELYNPTHKVQNIYNWFINDRIDGVGSNIHVDSDSFREIGNIAPLSYLVIVEAAGTVQDRATDNGGTDSSYITAVAGDLDLTDNNLTDSLFLRSDTSISDRHQKINGTGFLNDVSTNNGTPDDDTGSTTGKPRGSMERVYANRSGASASSWATSDSLLTYSSGSGYGSPGRPNSKALSAVTTKFFDRLDTDMGRDGGQTDETFDTVRVNFTLKIASGDTQPNQQIGVSALVEAGPANHSASNDSIMAVILTPTGVTNSAGTTYIQVSSNSNNFSGTVTIRLRQPYGVRDSTYVVFDRGDSFGYLFQQSETDIQFSSKETDLLVYVGFTDSFSGLYRSGIDINYDTPRIRWKFHKSMDTFFTDSHMNRVGSSDTYWARIDVGKTGDSYLGKAGDTIIWQVIWRDNAGNYDTSPDTFPMLFANSYEYIEPNDTVDIQGIPQNDTIGGVTLLTIRIAWSTTNTCTVVLNYDSDQLGSSPGGYDSVTIQEGGDSRMVLTSNVAGAVYYVRWILNNDMADTRHAGVRLRAQVYDADGGLGYLGETILIHDVRTVEADPPRNRVGRPLQHGVGIDTAWIRWTADTYAQYYTVWRDSGNPYLGNDTERLQNVTRAVFGTDSRSVDTFIYDTGVQPRTDTYYIWYVTSIDTWGNIHERPGGYGDSISAEYLYVRKRLKQLILDGVTAPDTRPGTMLEYEIEVSNTEGYSPVYRVQLIDWIPFYTDYKGTNTMIDTGDREDTQTDVIDTDYLRFVDTGDSQYIDVRFDSFVFNPGDTAKIRFRVIIR